MVATPAPQRAAGRRALARRGRALPDGGFPIPDGAYWDKARDAIGRVKDPQRRAQVAKLLRKTAPQVGRSAALKQSWAAPGGSQHANGAGGISLAVRAMLDNGQMLTCPECGHVAPAGNFGANGASLQKQPPLLRTPARGDVAASGFRPASAGIIPRGGKAAHALAGGTAGIELAGTLTGRRHPIHGPADVLVARGAGGTAVLKHRHGGAEIASLRKDGGKWVATVNGRDLTPRDHQRTALMEAVGTWNQAIQGAVRPQAAPLQPPPQQTALMAEYGIPAIRALATPATGAGAGPRVTLAGGTSGPDRDGGNDAGKDSAAGLSPKGRAVYRKLRAKGFTPQRALAFARNAGKPPMARAS